MSHLGGQQISWYVREPSGCLRLGLISSLNNTGGNGLQVPFCSSHGLSVIYRANGDAAVRTHTVWGPVSLPFP